MTTPASAALEEAPPVRPWAAWLLLVRNQLLGFLREPVAAVFNLVVPFFILLIQAAAFGDELIGEDLPAYRMVDVLPVAAALMFVMIIGIFGMGIGLASMIESRTMAIYRLRPGGLGTILSAYGLVLMVLAVAGLSASIIVLHLIWSIQSPHSLAVFALATLLGYAMFLGLGALVASVAGSPRAAQGIASAFFFPLLFLSGAVFPVDTYPEALKKLATALPGSHLYECLAYGWVVNDDSIPWLSALYLLILTIIVSLVAIKAMSHRERL